MKSTYTIRVWPDGRGHWFQILDRQCNVVQTTWGVGSAAAAREDAKRIVENLERAKKAA